MEKRHAYLILAHKNFGQLRKLVELLIWKRGMHI